VGNAVLNTGGGGLSASEDEIDFWDVFNPEIFKYVLNGKIWFNPDTGKQIAICPWLRKAPNKNIYTCYIYYDRPDDCKFYPVTIEQIIQDECEMIEDRVLTNPKQAQISLDKLMADSRPAS